MGAGALWSVSGYVTGKVSGKAAKSKAPEMAAQTQAPMAGPARVQARSLVATGKLPLAFEPNQGQTDAGAAYIAHGSGYGLFLMPTEAVLALGAGSKNSSPAAVRMQMEGASANPKIEASEALPGKVNYIRGNDRSRWVRNVPTFARVQYSSVYPGIDLVYYGKQGQLEYDFAVRSGADPNQIRLKLAGVDGMSLGSDGSLRLKTPARELRWNKPIVYQEVNGERRNVEGRFQLLAGNRVGFSVGRYDRGRDLIIDPVLAYATYFGGAGNEVNPQVAVDVNSNIYLSGTTSSATVPGPACGGTGEPVCPVLSGPTDVFVSKLDPIGSSVAYTTYINSGTLATGADSSAGLAVDNQGNVFITGTTTSSDFPVTASAFQSAPKAAGAHVFFTELDSTGATLIYSSYLSGSATDNAMALTANNSGQAFILGWTQSVASGDFPTGTSFQQSANGATRLYFVAKFDTTLSGAGSLKFFSYLGGGDSSNVATPADGVVCAQLPCGGITLDTTGNIFVAVGTAFTNMAAINAFQVPNNGGDDAFVAKITPDGGGLLGATYFGGSGDDVANAIALDSGGNAYFTGSTVSPDLPASSVKSLPAGGGQDAFVAKLSFPTTGAATLTFSSYLGGSGTDTGTGIVLDSTQSPYVTGATNSANFPVPISQAIIAAQGTDAFLVRLNPSVGSSASTSPVVFSQLMGGSGTDRATGIAVNLSGSVLLTGETNSTNFPAQSLLGIPVLQPALSGPSDAFLANYGPSTDLVLTITPSLNPVAAGNADTFTYTVQNNGPDPSTGAVLTIPLPLAASGQTVGAFSSASCIASGSTGNQIETCTLGTISVGNSTTVTVPVTATSIGTTPTVPATLSMGGHVAPGNSAVDPNFGNNNPPQVKANVEYFTTDVTPASTQVTAGQTASYTVTVTPHAPAGVTPVGFPANITLGCTLPTIPVAISGASCTFTPTSISTIANGTGKATSVLKITTIKPTATASVHTNPTIWYALWLPLCGLALFGAGSPRRRRWMTGAALVILLGTVSLLPACGKKYSAATATGTQPGVYSIQIKVTSGTYSNPPAASPLAVSLVVTAP